MAELIAQGPRVNDRWRRPLPEGETVLLGRDAGGWSVEWEPFLSRRHAELTYRKGQLEVRRHAEARNPIFRRGEEHASFSLRAGEHFTIGQTLFVLGQELAATEAVDSLPLRERTFPVGQVLQGRPRDEARHLKALALLPDLLTAPAAERLPRLARLLLAGVPRADVIGLLVVESERAVPRLLHCERRQAIPGDLPLSRRLIGEAVRRQEAVLHIWQGRPGEQFTQAEAFDWACCVPVRSGSRAIYLTGGFREPNASTVLDDAQAGGLADDLPFAELLAALWPALEHGQGR